MGGKIIITDGWHYTNNWIIFARNNAFVYGFRIKRKGISKAQRDFEIKEIIRSADEYGRGNKTGNNFLVTQMKYNGNAD